MIVDICFPGARVIGRALPDGVDEIVTITRDGPLIIYKRGLSVAEQRFAIAHAVGHLMFDMNCDSFAVGIGFSGDPGVEQRADRFGAELLVPLSVLGEIVSTWGVDTENFSPDQINRLADRFNAPTSVILERIARLNCKTEIHGEIVLT